MCAYFQGKRTTLTFLVLVCPKMELRLEIQKTNVGIKIKFFKILCVCQFLGKTKNFDFFYPNFPKNGYWGRNYRNLSPDLKPASPRYHMCKFSVKMNNLSFFGLNLGKLPNYVQYFGSNNVESLAESLVET